MNEELKTVPVTGPDGKIWNVKVPRGTSEDEVKAYVLRKKYDTTVAPVEEEVAPEPEPVVAETEEVAAEPGAEPERRFTGAGIGLTPGGAMIAEPVLSMLSGVASLVPSWLRAGYGLATGETDPEAAAAMRRTQREMTYQPRTELGKAGLQTIAPAAEVLSIPSQLIGTGVEKLTDSKVLGGIAEDVLGPEVLIPGVAGVKGLRKAKAADEIPTTPEVPKPVAETTVEQVVDTPKDLVQPPVGEMGPPKTGIVKSPDEVRAEIDEAKDVIEPSADLEETRLSAVGIPENLIADVKTIIGPEADIRVAPTVALQKEIVSAAKELLTEGQVRIDPSIPPMMQVANLLQSGRLAPDRYVEILKQNNLTPDDFSRFYIEEVSQAGRTLQTLSGFRKFSQAADLDAQIADVRAKIDQGTATPEDMQILDSLENQKNALEAINTSRAGGIVDDRGILKRIEDMRRGLMVSQLVTAVRNGTAGVGRSVLDTGTRLIDLGIQKATGRINPELPLQTAGDALGQVYALLNPKQSIDLTKQILSVRPKEYDELFRQYNAGVALGGKDSTILGQAEKGVYALNLFNRLQDSVFRSAVFADSIERGMKARNLDLKEIMASGRMGDIPEDLIQRGVQDAMEFTFSAKPKTRGEKAIVDAFENLPLGTVAVPFPRFMINSFRFMTEYSPLGPLHLLSKKERAAIAKGDTRLLSKTLAGSAMLYGAYSLRDSEYAGEKWYELKGDDGKTIDMRPYAPFSAYLFVGDLIKRNQDQTLYELDKRDISEAVLGVSTDRTGMQFVDELLKAAREDPETGKRGVKEVMERFAGEYAGTFFIPFQQARDVFAQFNEEESKVRRVKDAPLTGPIETKIPFVSQDLPESFSYVNPQTRVRESPLMRQVTGVTMISPKNEAEKELDRLQIKEFQIFKRTGNSDADRLIASKTAPVVQEKVSQAVSGERYQKLDNDQKRLILKRVMSEVYNEAKREAIKERPQLFIEDAVRKALSKDELRILEKRGFKIPKAEEVSEEKEEAKPEKDSVGKSYDLDSIISNRGAENLAPLIRSIYEQESSSGSANTSRENYAGAKGPMQVTRDTFKSMQASGIIPKDYSFDNQSHLAEAGVALIQDLARRYGNDPAKIAAAYYGGPAAVTEGGIRRMRRDPKNPKAPTVGEYADQVLSRIIPEAQAAGMARGGPVRYSPREEALLRKYAN